MINNNNKIIRHVFICVVWIIAMFPHNRKFIVPLVIIRCCNIVKISLDGNSENGKSDETNEQTANFTISNFRRLNTLEIG